MKQIINLAQKGWSEKQIEQELKIQFGLHVYSQKTIYEWIALMKLDKQDEPNGRPGTKLDDQFISRITQILNNDPFDSTRHIADELNEDNTTIWWYLTRTLGRVYKHSRWLPRKLNSTQKVQKVM